MQQKKNKYKKNICADLIVKDAFLFHSACIEHDFFFFTLVFSVFKQGGMTWCMERRMEMNISNCSMIRASTAILIQCQGSTMN